MEEGRIRRCLAGNAFTLVLTAVAVLMTGAPCFGQVDGPHVTIGPMAGYADWDEDVNLDSAWLYGGRLGLWANGYLGLEGYYGVQSATTLHNGRHWIGLPSTPELDQDLALYGASVIFNIAPTRTLSPYLTGGWQEAKYDANAHWPEETVENGPQFGAGLFIWPAPRVALRLEARDWMWKFDSPPAPDALGDEWLHNLVYMAGLEVALGGYPARGDADKDGVADRRDMCPDTPLGARVDSKGCPIDSDGDGVADGIDQCSGTPAGARVDARGCHTDSDGDGVADGIDACDDTPAGVEVDVRGCPQDADADGVFDGQDKCPNTQPGATVDAYGCPSDSDHDGVFDGLDKCPNTPAQAKVDLDGCPIVISEREIELLDTGTITVRNINFDTGKWDIPRAAQRVLDEIGGILIQWPELRVEIGGHTDSRGADASNQVLSEKRANAVREYLITHFPQIKADQYTAVGYGEKLPVADNRTSEGLARNRRVEFKVLNTEILKKERERREMLKK